MTCSARKIAYDSAGRTHVLQELVGAGNFGRVYGVNRYKVAKVFPRSVLNERRSSIEAKVRKLASVGRRARHRISFQIAFPLHGLLNRSGRFVGYLMPRVVDPVPLAAFFGVAERMNPGWGFAERRSVAIQVAELVAFMHVEGLVIGDLSSNNFLVSVDPTGAPRVHLIDVDSVQVPPFVERTRTERYLRPEEVKGDIETKTCIDSDLHALAFLVFEAFMRGVSPYAHRGGGSTEENIAAERFPYTAKCPCPDAPVDFAKYWHELSPSLRESFLSCFSGERLSARDWVRVLRDSPERPKRRRRVRRWFFTRKERKAS